MLEPSLSVVDGNEHISHDALPGDDEILPTGQLLHDRSPIELYVPLPQIELRRAGGGGRRCVLEAGMATPRAVAVRGSGSGT